MFSYLNFEVYIYIIYIIKWNKAKYNRIAVNNLKSGVISGLLSYAM